MFYILTSVFGIYILGFKYNYYSIKKALWCSFSWYSLIVVNKNIHWRCLHVKPLFCTQLLSFHLPSWYISTQFSLPTSPSWMASLGSPGAQFVKANDVRSVQPHPTRDTSKTLWHLIYSSKSEPTANTVLAYTSDPWSDQSRHCGIWCNWFSWWIPPQLDCGWRLNLLLLPPGSNVVPPATRSPLSHYKHNSSVVRMATSLANTSRHREQVSLEAFLKTDFRCDICSQYIRKVSDVSDFYLKWFCRCMVWQRRKPCRSRCLEWSVTGRACWHSLLLCDWSVHLDPSEWRTRANHLTICKNRCQAVERHQ